MTHQAGTSLAPWNRRLLMTAAAATVAAPVVAGALTPGTALTTSQAPSADRHRFEVAAVRPNATGAMRVRMQIMPGGAYEASNVTLESVIRMAYRLQEFQLAGGPDWIYRDRFDIVVKSPQSASPIDFLERMQSLLGERFQLKVRTETRELPIYALVLAHDDGRLGPRLTTGTIDCAALVRARASSADGDEADLLPRPGERPTCGTWTAMGRLAGGGVTMDQLATSLSQHTGRVVVNRTGLNGSFDFDLEFAPDPALRGRGPGGGLPPAPPDARPPSPGGVSIFAAVREQLGLRLDARRGPVEVLVVDSAERPMAD